MEFVDNLACSAFYLFVCLFVSKSDMDEDEKDSSIDVDEEDNEI